MIPVIQSEIEANNWMDTGQFTDVIAISAMAPGPIASNSATIVGFKLAGLEGAIITCIGVTLPSFILLLIIGKFLKKFKEAKIIESVFYGLRPAITGIIAFAAVKFAAGNGIIGGSNFIDIKSLAMTIIAFLVIVRTKLHPVYIILISGAAGILIFK